MSLEGFDPQGNEEAARLFTLTNIRGSKVTVMDIGATWISCQIAMERGLREVLLGCGSLAQYQRQAAYLGASIGRYANRIALGRFSVGEQDYQTTINHGQNMLHGGIEGYDKRRWRCVEQMTQSVTLALDSQDGDQGFPGNVAVSVTYTLSDDDSVDITYQANTDRATPINLTNHAYFNLQGAESGISTIDHQLEIAADYYLPTDEFGIPLGELVPVAGTSFDFRQPKNISQDLLEDEQQRAVKGYDHSFLLTGAEGVIRKVATVIAGDRSLAMEVYTDKPAIQFYGGNWLDGTPNRSGGEYGTYMGFALETQYLPDSPNHPEWPQSSCIFDENRAYCFHTRYKFSA